MIEDFILELLFQFREAYPIFFIFIVILSIICIPIIIYDYFFGKFSKIEMGVFELFFTSYFKRRNEYNLKRNKND